MPMSLSVIQTFEALRTLRDRAVNKTSAMVKGQSASAPLVPTVEMLEDLHDRLTRLEAEQDKKGIMVPDPAKSLVDFVHASVGEGAVSHYTTAAAVKALMGRVMHEVRKVKAESEGELRAAMSQKKDDWRHESVGGVQAMVKLEERLTALLTGKAL